MSDEEDDVIFYQPDAQRFQHSDVHFMAQEDPIDQPTLENVQFEIQLVKEPPAAAQTAFDVLLYQKKDQEDFSEWISDSLDYDVIEPCSSEDILVYTNHFLVPKSDGKRRIVGNFKPLKSVSLKHHFKGPSSTKIVSWASSFPFTAKIDLRNGYHNVIVSEESRRLLGFRFEGEHFRYKRIPMGVTNGPYYFNLYIGQIIRELPADLFQRVQFYVDDIIIVGSTQSFCFCRPD